MVQRMLVLYAIRLVGWLKHTNTVDNKFSTCLESSFRKVTAFAIVDTLAFVQFRYATKTHFVSISGWTCIVSEIAF